MHKLLQHKSLFALVMGLFLVVQALNKPLIFLGFKWQEQYLVEQRCENRFSPELMCKASCVLKSQLDFADTDKDIRPVKELLKFAKEGLLFSPKSPLRLSLYASHLPRYKQPEAQAKIEWIETQIVLSTGYCAHASPPPERC